jgi:hypothetical protein
MKTNFGGPGPASYDPTSFEKFLKRANLDKIKLKKSTIDRLDFTLLLYHPAWESR